MTSTVRARWYSGLLLLAFIPSVAYVGHWEPRFDIPLTDYYWGIPDFGQHSAHHDASSHGDHCHGDSTCSDQPTTAGASVALIRDDIEMIGMAALLLLVASVLSLPHVPGSRAPETPPPRARFLAT